MEKTYQPQVLEICENMMRILTEDGFFSEYQVTNSEPARIPLCDFLTEKFIKGEIIDGKTVDTTEDEMLEVFNLMISSCILGSLKEKGLIDSFEDENNEELFFPTKMGKLFGKRLNKNM